MSTLGTARLLGFARGLQRATSFAELLAAVREEVVDALEYQHVWFFVADDDAATELRIIDAVGTSREAFWEFANKLKVSGDPFLEQVVASDEPVIVVDARTDPRTNKEIVAKIGNRTIVNVPLRLLDKPFGVLGIGTFGDEGCRVPSPQQLEYLVAMAAHVAVAAGRIRYQAMKASADAEKLAYERRLLQSEKLESLGMLAGGIAHDFNNLLTVILSGAELAQCSVTDASGREELQAVVDAALRARGLSRQLVAMSRSQALDLQTMDVNARLTELLGLLRRLLPTTLSIDLSQDGEGEMLVECDGSQFDQVLLNLCVNARDAMPAGGRIRIETSIAEVDAARLSVKPGRYVRIKVTDSGIGMDHETTERVFEPFFSTKAPGKGTGLGLAVSYGIVRQHDGAIQCSSEPGSGTTFEIYLPLHAGPVPKPVKPTAIASSGGKERLLVADDDAAIRALCTRILVPAGYDVTVVASGGEVLEAAAAERFDLFVLDVRMPGPSIRDIIAQLRERRPEAGILLSSGFTGTDVTSLIRASELSMLAKPYSPDQLLAAVRQTLGRRSPTLASP